MLWIEHLMGFCRGAEHWQEERQHAIQQKNYLFQGEGVVSALCADHRATELDQIRYCPTIPQ